VVHGVLPGRLRIHLRGWQAGDRAALERRLQLVPGVRTVRATPATGNILFLFDPSIVTAERLLSAAESALGQDTDAPRARVDAKLKETSIATPRGRIVTAAAKPARRQAVPLARKLLVHLPALLGLVLSLLTCSTPLGYARFGLEVVQVAIQFGSAGA
jgi:hypothetical protein